jgi:hypothetical protein
LSKYLHADNNLDYVSKITIDFAVNDIHEVGALHVASMLYYFEHLYLSYNPIGDTGASLISEAVRETATLKTLILNECYITSRGAKDLSRALAQNRSLEKLDIGLNNLGDEGISHVAEALKQNTHLKELCIGGGVMTDKGAASLASALKVNNSLKMLRMGGDEGVTVDGLSAIAHSLANKSLFVKLAIPVSVGFTSANRFSLEVNEARKRSGLPPIEIEGEYIVCCIDMSCEFVVFPVAYPGGVLRVLEHPPKSQRHAAGISTLIAKFMLIDVVTSILLDKNALLSFKLAT